MNPTELDPIVCRGCGVDLSDGSKPCFLVKKTDEICAGDKLMTKLCYDEIPICEKCHYDGFVL